MRFSDGMAAQKKDTKWAGDPRRRARRSARKKGGVEGSVKCRYDEDTASPSVKCALHLEREGLGVACVQRICIVRGTPAALAFGRTCCTAVRSGVHCIQIFRTRDKT